MVFRVLICMYDVFLSVAIDPKVVGEDAYSCALREGAQLDDELRNDAKSIEWILGPGKRCPCDVRKHPSRWSHETIRNVHKYSFLLSCEVQLTYYLISREWSFFFLQIIKVLK